MADVSDAVREEEEEEEDAVAELSAEQSGSVTAQRIESCKRDFHVGRRLVVEGLPADATQEDVSAMLDSLPVTEVQLNLRTRTATVAVTRPEEVLEAWAGPPRTMGMRDGSLEVRVSLSPSERLLCLAHLPLIYSEEDFRNLVQMFGPVTRCFLMRSQETGNSKGYGFVEYASKEVASQARSLLEGKAIGNCTLHCDWLDPSHVTYASLHSKCLYVDHLPPNFRDVDELRHLFSVVIKPIYCQVVLKNGESTGVGLVEFGTWEAAEETQRRLHGHQMDKYKLRVTFCVPGVHAATVYNQLTNGLPANGKKALLPDPAVNPALCSQLQMLAMHNPQFFQSLQAAATNQLQNLQNNNQVHKGSAHDKNKKAVSGLLGSPPSLSNNPNIQAAMVLLLATQMQMRLQQPNMLGNPQLLAHFQNMIKMNNASPNPTALSNAAAAGGNLQSLLSQLSNAQAVSGPPSSTQGPGNPTHPSALQPNNAGLPAVRMPSAPASNLQSGLAQGGGAGSGYTKTPLLPKPNDFSNNSLGRGLLPTPSNNMSSPPWSSPPLSNGHPKPWEADFRHDCRPPNLPPPKVPLLGDRPRPYDMPPVGKLPLLGDRPGVSVAPMVSSCSSSLSPTSSVSSLTSDVADTSPLLGPPPSLPIGLGNHISMTSPPPTFNNQSSNSHNNNGPIRHSNLVPGFPPPFNPNFVPNMSAIHAPEGINFPCNGNSNNEIKNAGVSYPPMDATQLNQLNQLNLQLERLGNHPLIHLLLQAANGKQKQQDQPNGQNNGLQTPNLLPTPPKPSLLGCPPPPTHPVPSPPSLLGSPAQPKGSLLGDFPWPNNNNVGVPQYPFPNQKMTPSQPQGQKRKLHSLLPLPETSPESSYIGQHSQGIGGHYADTYSNKRPRM